MGNYRVYRYLYYCRYAWKFSEVTISDKFEKNNSNILIIDRNSVKNIRVSNSLKKYKIFICLWNGIFDQKREEIVNFEKKLLKLKIDYNIFLVGYNEDYLKNKKFYFIEDKIFENKSVKIYCKFKYRFIFYYPNLFHLIKIFFNFKKFIQYFFCYSKIIFIGGGILDEDELKKNFRNKSSFKENRIIKRFFDQSKKVDLDELSDYFKNVINSSNFKNLKYHQKIFLFQRLSRHIFLSNLKSYKNFFFIKRDFNLGLLNSRIFFQHYFLDFGSSVGFGLYDRSFLLYRNHRNKTLKIDFIKKQKNFKEIFKKFDKLNNKVKNYKDKNLSALKLARFLQKWDV